MTDYSKTCPHGLSDPRFCSLCRGMPQQGAEREDRRLKAVDEGADLDLLDIESPLDTGEDGKLLRIAKKA
jgi:hypothetical protein